MYKTVHSTVVTKKIVKFKKKSKSITSPRKFPSTPIDIKQKLCTVFTLHTYTHYTQQSPYESNVKAKSKKKKYTQNK